MRKGEGIQLVIEGFAEDADRNLLKMYLPETEVTVSE